MARPENVLRKYVVYNGSARKEYVTYGAVKEETAYSINLYFTLGGKGISSQATARTLGALLETAKGVPDVKEGRRSAEEIKKGTKMVKTHHEKLIEQLEEEVEEHGSETTAEEWVKELKE